MLQPVDELAAVKGFDSVSSHQPLNVPERSGSPGTVTLFASPNAVTSIRSVVALIVHALIAITLVAVPDPVVERYITAARAG